MMLPACPLPALSVGLKLTCCATLPARLHDASAGLRWPGWSTVRKSVLLGRGAASRGRLRLTAVKPGVAADTISKAPRALGRCDAGSIVDGRCIG